MAMTEISRVKMHYIWISPSPLPPPPPPRNNGTRARERVRGQISLPCPEEVGAPDVLRIGGRVSRRVESSVLRRLQTDEFVVAHCAGHQPAVRLE